MSTTGSETVVLTEPRVIGNRSTQPLYGRRGTSGTTTGPLGTGPLCTPDRGKDPVGRTRGRSGGRTVRDPVQQGGTGNGYHRRHTLDTHPLWSTAQGPSTVDVPTPAKEPEGPQRSYPYPNSRTRVALDERHPRTFRTSGPCLRGPPVEGPFRSAQTNSPRSGRVRRRTTTPWVGLTPGLCGRTLPLPQPRRVEDRFPTGHPPEDAVEPDPDNLP